MVRRKGGWEQVEGRVKKRMGGSRGWEGVESGRN